MGMQLTKYIILTCLFILVFVLSISAQKVTKDVIYVNGVPTTCIFGKTYINQNTGFIYTYKLGVGCFLSGSGGGSVGGANTQVLYNNGGVMAGDADFTFNNTTNALSVNTAIIKEIAAGFPAFGNTAIFDTGSYAIIAGPSGDTYINSLVGQPITIRNNNSNIWQWNTDGHLIPTTTNSKDLGTSSFAIRTGYFATSVDVGGSKFIVNSSGLQSVYNNVTTAGLGDAAIYGNVALTAQAASIGATNLYASAPAGMYRVCWNQRITQAATTSSSLITTIGWNNGSAKTSTLASLNGGALQTTADASNALNSTLANCIIIESAASQNITYATTYASSGGTPMQYALKITAERLQ